MSSRTPTRLEVPRSTGLSPKSVLPRSRRISPITAWLEPVSPHAGLAKARRSMIPRPTKHRRLRTDGSKSDWYLLEPSAGSTSLGEEPPQLLRGFVFADASQHIGSMVAGRLGEDPCSVHDCATLRVLGGKAQRSKSRDRDGRRAHRTGLERDPQYA